MTRIYSASEIAAAADQPYTGCDDRVDWAGLCAREWATYKQALEGVVDLDPALLIGDAKHPLNLLDEAAVALFSEGCAAGIRIADAHHAGGGFVAPQRLCSACHGLGALWDGSSIRRVGAAETECAVCGGSGILGSAGWG